MNSASTRASYDQAWRITVVMLILTNYFTTEKGWGPVSCDALPDGQDVWSTLRTSKGRVTARWKPAMSFDFD